MDFALAELCDQVMTARAGHKPIHILGGRSKHFYGNVHAPSAGDATCLLDMTAYDGIVDYHPSELVVTVKAGTPLLELQQVLADQGQMLGFEPPHFGPTATIGGCVAAGLSGPARMAAGSVRDFVLGTRLLDAQGRLLSFGGEVVKNVAGYDVSRVLTGSLGMFGALVEISLKVVPIPAAQATVARQIDAEHAVKLFSQWRLQPLPITAGAWVPGEKGGVQWLRVAGSEVAVANALSRIGGDQVEPDVAKAFWTSLREQTHSFFEGNAALWRLAVAPATPPARDEAHALIEWNGGQRWLRGPHAASAVRAMAASAGGHATFFRNTADSGPPDDGVFHPPAPALGTIMQRLKNEFDPWRLFNPGRLLPDA